MSEQTRIRKLAAVPLDLRGYGGLLSFKTFIVFSTLLKRLCRRKRHARDHSGNFITTNILLHISPRKLQLFRNVEFIIVTSPACIQFSPPPYFSLVRPLLRSSLSTKIGGISIAIPNNPRQGPRFPEG